MVGDGAGIHRSLSYGEQQVVDWRFEEEAILTVTHPTYCVTKSSQDPAIMRI
jgi:hypothetical protein